MIMEADESQDLLSASWRLRRADGVKAYRLETQEGLMFQSESKGRKKKPMSQLKEVQQRKVLTYQKVSLLFYSGL